MTRHATAPNEEPEQSNFKIPAEREHLFQVVDIWEDKNDPDVQVVKLEVVGGDDNGISVLQRTNINDQLKSFFFCRMFLKAIDEPYKGSFEISPENWVGKQFYATVKHSQSKGKTYANIGEYNFDKKIEQYKAPVAQPTPKSDEIVW